MNTRVIESAVAVGAGIHAAIVLANIPLPGRLKVKETLASVPSFLRQIFYVHWLYIVIVVSLFSMISFLFAPDLAGRSGIGTFLSAAIAVFWLLRIALQWGYYDAKVRRQNRALDMLYSVALISLVGVYATAAANGLMRSR